MTDIDLENVTQGEPVNDALSSSPENNVADDLLSKAEVSKIVARERQKALEKGRQEALMELQQAQQAQQSSAPQAQPQVNIGGMAQVNPEEMQRMIAEQMPHALQEHVNNLQTKHIVDSFVTKMQAAEARHPGLEAKLNELDYNSLAPLIHMANGLENTGDVMKELIDNPMKMGNLLALAHGQPKLAQRAIQELSNSIKNNQEALSQEKQAQDPMSQLKPSTSAGMDNGDMSVADFRKMFKKK